MRVLAIRARNLASLPEFELDLTRGTLARTRIFAITGPTGAGKSTLLDALCLALYDRAPRLQGSRDAPGAVTREVAREGAAALPARVPSNLEVSAVDPRSLVRRGAAEASAEVDFATEDGRRYRAIWEVWRAHRRPGGKLQSQRLRLLSLDGAPELTGATKTETLARIEALIGLGYDEFRRAVLLAQGDFATFLKARPDERAALLERMTGTEIYAELSRAAFARARDEDERLRALETSLRAEQVLAPEARAEVEAQLEAQAAARAALAASAEARRRARDEADAILSLLDELEAEGAALARARDAWAASAAERAELESARAAAALRGEFEAAEAAETGVAEARVRLAGVAAAHAAAATARTAAVAQATRATTAHTEALEAARRQAPELDAARTLDVQIEEARRLALDGAALRAQKAAVRGAATAAAEAVRRDLEARVAARDRQVAWLEAREGTRVLAAQWPRWERELERFAGAREALRARAADRDRALAVLVDRAEAQARLEAARAAAEARAATAQDAIATAREALDAHRHAHPPASIQEACERIGREIGSLEAMKALVQGSRRVVRALSAAERDLEARRADVLVPGEPCPLCGSREHPFARPGAAGPGTSVAPEPRRPDAGGATPADVPAADVPEPEPAFEAVDRIRKLAPEVARAEADWRARLEALQLLWLDSPLLAQRGLARTVLAIPVLPTARDAIAEVDRVIARFQAEGEALRALLTEEAALARRLDEARAAEERARAERAGDGPRAEALAREVSAARESVGALEAALARERAIADDALAALAQPFEGRQAPAAGAAAASGEAPGEVQDWRAALEADPAAFLRAARREVEAWETAHANRRDLEEAIRALERDRDRAQAEADMRREDLAAAEALAAGCDARLASLTAVRGTLLGGRTLAEATSAAAEAIAEAEAQARDAGRRAAEAAEHLAATLAQRTAAAEAHARAEERRGAEDARLAAALAGSTIPDRAALAALLARGPAWIAERERAVAALKEAILRLEGSVEDRRLRLARRLEAAGRPPEPPPRDEVIAARREAHDALTAAEAALAEAQAREARARGQLDLDDEARARVQTLLPRIEAQRSRLAGWAELSALIGSADGKKLRAFAQGLSLDALLEQANLQLRQLRPRYRLARVPGQDMDLEVVDGDMGDEVRAVSTLSGGETFLVSLALALALSSLSARNVRIRSLFIDEGFGTLDRETIESALATLDQLQAEGRTIGLISHVPELAERIGFQVQVRPIAPGRSEVVVLA